MHTEHPRSENKLDSAHLRAAGMTEFNQNDIKRSGECQRPAGVDGDNFFDNKTRREMRRQRWFETIVVNQSVCDSATQIKQTLVLLKEL